MPRANFIPIPGQPGEGRCRVCDLPYSIDLPGEVAHHHAFHRRYLQACSAVGAPINEEERERLHAEGLDAQVPGAPFSNRVEGAEKWLTARYHTYLRSVLLHGGPRLDLRAYFTKRVEEGGLLNGNFDPEVVQELRLRYSEHRVC